MNLKRRKTDRPHGTQRCQCGWVGSQHQLAVWLRKDQVVSRICPQCGTPSPLHTKLSYCSQVSRLVH